MERDRAYDFGSRTDDPWYDTDSAHSVPYSLYATGLGYRADKIPDMSGSWTDLSNPLAEGRAFMPMQAPGR